MIQRRPPSMDRAPQENDVDDGYGDLETIEGQEALAADRDERERQNEAMLSGNQSQPQPSEGFDDGLTRHQDFPQDPELQETPPQSTGRAPEADELATEEQTRSQRPSRIQRQRPAPRSETGTSGENGATQTRPVRRERRPRRERANPRSLSEANPDNMNDDPVSTLFGNGAEESSDRPEATPRPDFTIQEIIEGFRNIKELGELDERFIEAREAFMKGREGENGRELREEYLKAGETLQVAMDAMVRKGAGLTAEERERQGFPPAFAPTVEQINDAFSHDENETFNAWANRNKNTTAEASPDHDLESLFEQFPGESPLLKERFLKAREDYLHATKKKREKLRGTQKNIRLSPHEAKLRDVYLASRNDLLYALTSIARPGAGFTRTESEKKRGLVDKGATVGAVLDTLIEGEQRVLGEDGFSTLHAYDSFEKTLVNDIRKRAKDTARETKGKRKAELRPVVARDFIERGDDLNALATTVSLKREAYRNKILEKRLSAGKKGMVDPMRVGLRKNPGFFSWIEDIFGRRPRRKS